MKSWAGYFLPFCELPILLGGFLYFGRSSGSAAADFYVFSHFCEALGKALDEKRFGIEINIQTVMRVVYSLAVENGDIRCLLKQEGSEAGYPVRLFADGKGNAVI